MTELPLIIVAVMAVLQSLVMAFTAVQARKQSETAMKLILAKKVSELRNHKPESDSDGRERGVGPPDELSGVYDPNYVPDGGMIIN